jgi:hypothetical protein
MCLGTFSVAPSFAPSLHEATMSVSAPVLEVAATHLEAYAARKRREKAS